MKPLPLSAAMLANELMIRGARTDDQQQFERQLLGNDGIERNKLVIYPPATLDGAPSFIAQVVEVNRLKEVEAALRQEIAEHNNAIVKLREAGIQLLASDETFRETLGLNGQIPWTACADGSLFAVNEAWAERWPSLTGLPIETTLEDLLRASMHPADVDRIAQDTLTCTAAGLPLEQRYRLRTPDGSYRWWRSEAAPRRNTQGVIVKWYGTIEDIHDQVVEEEQQHERDAAYRLIVELSGQIPWTTSADGTMFSVGDEFAGRWAALTGRPATETVAEYRTAIHPADFERIGWNRDAAVAVGHPIDHRYRLRMADGDYRWWHSRSSPLRDRQGDVVRWYGTLEDIHDRVLDQERVQNLETELVQFERLAAMNSLASTLAHELNQPLAAANNYVNGARRLLASGDMTKLAAVDSALEAAATSTMRSAGIIRSLRGMVAKGAVNRCDESIASIIEDACQLAMPDATFNGLEIVVSIAPGLTTIHVDRVQFKQVLINLLRNAADAVEARPVRKITIEARRQTDVVEIIVSDTGMGVATDRVDQLFEAFNSTKVDGLGIGLSISRTIVEANGGKLSYAAAPGGGACFTITVPD